MFMHQKRNETTRLIWIVTQTVYPLGSLFKLPRGECSLKQMRLLCHTNIKQRCEIRSVWNAWIQRRTQAEQEKHCVQRRDSQK